MIAFPLALFLFVAASTWGKRFEMDNGMGVGSFFAVFAIYRRLSYVIFTVGFAIAVFAADKKWPPATILSGAAALYAFLFNFWMVYCYESYLHSKYPRNITFRTLQEQAVAISSQSSNYFGWKYAITLALGFSSVILFISGIIIFLMTLMER